MSDSQVLPLEAGSRSELLSTRNVFAIQVLSLAASAWKMDESIGLEARTLTMNARLLQVFKGPDRPAVDFRVSLPQRREDALTISDFHGFWSHREVEVGRQYIAFSNGAGNDPAAWMEDSVMVELAPATPATAAEIALAVDVERRFAPVNSREKAVEVLKTLFANRDTVSGLFGRYACARLSTQYEAYEDPLQAGLMRVVMTDGSTESLRESLIEYLYDESAEHEPSQDKAIKLAQRFIAWARQPEAATMLDRLIDVHLYNLIFPPDEPALPVGKVVPASVDRTALQKIFASHLSPRSSELIAWLTTKP
ncbi:MAG: hypothetical protein JST93_11845 [Acidobacteria bacterium]|nr:hypothetical protein [Acidobacteriota bacterium]